jgi:hypothetical protein
MRSPREKPDLDEVPNRIVAVKYILALVASTPPKTCGHNLRKSPQRWSDGVEKLGKAHSGRDSDTEQAHAGDDLKRIHVEIHRVPTVVSFMQLT